MKIQLFGIAIILFGIILALFEHGNLWFVSFMTGILGLGFVFIGIFWPEKK